MLSEGLKYSANGNSAWKSIIGINKSQYLFPNP